MKKYIFLLILVTSFVNGQNITFSDANFKAKLLNANSNNSVAKNLTGNYFKIDSNSDNEISLVEALQVSDLNLNLALGATDIINNIEGIENFTNIKILKCNYNNVSQVNITNLLLLEEFHMHNNQLVTINVSNLVNLKILFVRNNSLTSITFLNNNTLESIWVSDNNLTSLDLSLMPAIEVLVAQNNNITNLNISGLSNLIEINCSNNSISSLDLTNKPLLKWLTIKNNLFTTIDVLNLSALISIDVSENNLSSINLNGLTNLEYAYISNTLLTTFDGSNCSVRYLTCENNSNLTSINVKNNYISFSDPDLLFFAFKVTNNPLLQYICVDNGEQNNLAYFNYNTSGNVQVYGGINCDVPLQVMSSESFKNNEVILFPNPVKNELNFSFEKTISIERINIYNTLGQLVKQFNGNLNSINLSDVNTGYYHIEFVSDEGKLTKKFIKE
jgi:Leucine-rich repeat (LRR) protein